MHAKIIQIKNPFPAGQWLVFKLQRHEDWMKISFLQQVSIYLRVNRVGSRFTTGLRSRKFGRKTNRRKTGSNCIVQMST
jgi:hypothetical protein